MKGLIITALLAGCSFHVSAAETIRFATEASYAPFEFIDANNQIQGFDIDLANALCEEIRATCTFSNQAFNSLVPGLNYRRFDAVIAGMDIAPERQKQVSFTQPYYNNSALFIAQKGKYQNIDALKGKRVGVQNGTTYQRYLQEKYADITTVPYDSHQNAILDLKNGRLDAVFSDTAVINEWLKKNPTLSALGDKVTDEDYFGIGLGIAVRKGNQELVNKFNDALAKIKQNGVYQTIYQKWFP